MDNLKNLLTPINLIIIAIGIVVVLGAGYFLFLSNRGAAPQVTEEQTVQEVVEEEAESTTVVLAELKDSGQSGSATLTEVDGQTNVMIELDVASDVAQPAHIHTGACPDVGDVVYPLTNVVDGVSETVLDVDLATLLSERPLAINVHKSTQEASVYTSCGDL
ncbi:MAG: CHRD domain-containing protein [Candidatus Levybacteria bacterium]|nr:CHRD domain-containing protein [Candidatus Levybacteria bacterium]